jgi:uncharacterized protein involved in exopolysaccharide biosynthesis
MLHASSSQLDILLEALNRDRERRLELEKAIADAKAAMAAAEETRATEPAAEEPTAKIETAPFELPPGPATVRLRAARVALEQMEMRLTPEHPDIIQAKRIIERLERDALAEDKAPDVVRDAQLRQAEGALKQLDAQIAQRTEQEQRLREAIATYRDRIEAVPTRESDWTKLTRDYGTSQQIYTSLLAKKEESKVAANLERRQIAEQFRMADPPGLPTRPSSPNRPQIVLFGMLLGLGFGVGLVILAELRDSSLRSEEEVVATLGVPVLAMLPVIVMPAERRRARMRRLIGSAALAVAAAAIIAWRWL